LILFQKKKLKKIYLKIEAQKKIGRREARAIVELALWNSPMALSIIWLIV
jgi:hypothetical protein